MLTFPDVEGLVIAYLKPHFDGWRIATRIPADVPALFLHVRRTGGPVLNRIVDQPQITFTAWGEMGDTVAPSEAINLVRTLMLSASKSDGGIPSARVVAEISGPYVDDDPETGRPRYSYTNTMRVRATRTLVPGG